MVAFFKGWRRLRQCAAVVLAFGVAVIGEAGIRALAVRPIPVSVVAGVRADVKADVRPDFMWIGRAWCVSINCEEPVSVEFDKQWKANVPAGKHRIYHNHDSNNTAEFATHRWWETPTIITVTKK